LPNGRKPLKADDSSKEGRLPRESSMFSLQRRREGLALRQCLVGSWPSIAASLSAPAKVEHQPSKNTASDATKGGRGWRYRAVALCPQAAQFALAGARQRGTTPE
jgi:hypothetical protein